MYGRPETDYLFCWRVPGLEDTAWCHQKSDQPTSAVNYPWYGMTRTSTGYYRSLDKITDEYINDQQIWNANVTVDEIPDAAGIKEESWVPEVYCHHEFDNKLLRNIWTKIFTVTPRLNDLRNNLTWTRTGNGALYAGGGFRREPACWWECCRRCAPFCDCACTQGCASQICCLQADFDPPSVNNVIEITIPYTTVAEGAMQITYNSDQTVATADNGAVKIVSTGNMPFELSASFSKKESSGVYTVTLVYTPIGGYSGHMSYVANYDQFDVAQDIVLNYTLKEDASDFQTGIKETFSTTLVDHVCRCVCPIRDPITLMCICPPGCGASADCCCCPSEAVSITTDQSVEDSDVIKVNLDMRKIDALKLAANSFVDLAMAKNMQVGLVAFSSPPTCPGGICSSHVLSTNAADLHLQIDAYQPSDGTCTSCGIHEGISLLSGASGAKYEIVMSDGKPNFCLNGGQCQEPTAKAEALAQATAAKAAGITVDTIALGNDADYPFMESLAEAGGGKYYSVTCECPLDCIYNKLANEDTSDNVVLVSDISGSMSDKINLNCQGTGTPIIHKFGAINITVNGNIDNYMDSDLTTGIRSEGHLDIDGTPDIINELSLNVAESSIDFYSMVYPIKHMDWRKAYSQGYWEPGYPYAVGEAVLYNPKEAVRNYFFDQAYGYESFNYNYPQQCQKICPEDCTCNDYDITDTTCTDASGNTYKRDDCVCLPPQGQTYQTFCTSDRTFHEEENYYFDFVEMETREVTGDINVIAGQSGTNPQFTGNLRGEVQHNLNNTVTPPTSGCQENLPEIWDIPSNAVLLPTDPADAGADDQQKEPLLVHGLAWRLAECASDLATCGINNADGLKIGRAIGPIEIAGKKYNAGPYIVVCPNSNPSDIVAEMMNKRPEFANVDYNVIGTATTINTVEVEPVSFCISDGPYDQPTKLFDAMHIPYATWTQSCLNNSNVLIFGCDSTPTGVATNEQIQNFVSNCGTYIATDLSYFGGIDQIFPGKINGDAAGDGTATIWEGTTKGSYDLPDNLKRFFQTSYETVSGWNLLSGTMVINSLGSGVDTLATGDYTVGGTNKPMAVTFKEGNGRVFYYPIHIEGSTQMSQQAFMSSIYSSASMASKNIGNSSSGSGNYVIDFEALNFPNPLLAYENETWNSITPNINCNDYCRQKGLFSAAVCACPQDPTQKGCVYANNTGGGYQYCQPDCTETFGADYATQCCCAKPHFKTDDANLTVYIHFRNNASDQTFNLFPNHEETKPYAHVKINVTIREPSRISCTVNDSIKSGDNVDISASLIDPLTGQGIADEPVTIEVEAYGLKKDIRTDGSGNVKFPTFIAGDQSTKITCSYAGGKKYTESSSSTYMNIYSLNRVWWFVSPEVLLLLIVLIVLAFSYKWFRGGGFDLYSLWDELRGKK